MKPALLLKSTRANITEREHYGYVMVVDKNENVISEVGNNNDEHFFMRSCAKPFQALPIILSETFNNFNFSLKELAVCSASHSGSKEHLSTIRGILEKIGLNENKLQCGGHMPSDIATKNDIIKNNSEITDIYNNCSGKHAGMLSVCVNNNWDIDTYLDFNHPLQLEILSVADKYCNCNGIIDISIDNCSTPMYGMHFAKMGAGYLRLFLSNEGTLLRKAFMENPVLIGGNGNLDTTLMEATNGKLISKIGAEGLCITVNTEKEKALIVKAIDGNVNARSLITIEALKQLGWLSEKDLNNESLKKLDNRDVRSLKDKLVGDIRVMFDLSKELILK